MQRLFKEKRTWFLVTALLLAVALYHFVPSIPRGIKKITLGILSAPANAINIIGDRLRSRNDLEQENRLLRKEVAELSLRIDRLEELKKENERFRALLEFKADIGFNTVSAEVIARNPTDWESSFIINKGTRDGLRKNMAVCSSEGLLGKTVEVQNSISSVMLITHPGFRAGGTLKDSRINGVIAGGGKGKVRMLYIPADADVETGEIAITSGFSHVFPEGITVGEVVSVEKSGTGLYKYAILKPSAEASVQEEVLCIE
ncbi:MAG: rod shape-determining protein MreC [Candidatus Omnitrophica bacterium]|nr:rod shape-determining protein MreC [Candidatus Omnitrophota bacterium]